MESLAFDTHLSEPVKRQARLGIALAMIAGYVDGFGLLGLKTFLSLMSGNTTKIGCHLGRGEFSPNAPAIIAIASFLTGVIAGNLLKHAGLRRPRRLAFGGTGALLAAVVAGTQLAEISDALKITLTCLAMGLLNTTLSRVGNQAMSFTYVTGALNYLGGHIALALLRRPLEDAQGAWDTHLWRAFLLASVWAGFLGGAILVGMMMPRLGGWTLLPPAMVLLILAWLGRGILAED